MAITHQFNTHGERTSGLACRINEHQELALNLFKSQSVKK